MGVTLKAIVDFIGKANITHEAIHQSGDVLFIDRNNTLRVGNKILLNNMTLDNFLTQEELTVIKSTAGDKLRAYIKGILS